MTLPESWPIVALALGCAYASHTDLFYRRIANWLSVVLLCGGLLSALLVGGWGVMGDHAFHAFLALIVGMALTALHLIGAGDAKFYAACASWFAVKHAPGLLLVVSLAGLALFLAWFTWRRIKRLPIGNKTGSPFDSLPYGIAIAVGAVAAALVYR